jgi:hypothetical protein
MQSGEPSHVPKDAIGPVGSLWRHPMIPHESKQDRRMALLFPDEQFNYPKHVRNLLRLCESFGRSKECPSLRLFAELERCDRARDELLFVGPQNIGKPGRNTARVPGMMFEVIQPDLEFSRIHAAALVIAYTECGSSFG